MTGKGRRFRWRHRLSLRLRITLLTAAVVAVVVALGGFLILVALRAALVSAADEAVEARAQEMAAVAVRDELPRPVPATHDPVTFAEVVAGGRTVTASEGLGWARWTCTACPGSPSGDPARTGWRRAESTRPPAR
jgi:acyl transferase domain-containing protein